MISTTSTQNRPHFAAPWDDLGRTATDFDFAPNPDDVVFRQAERAAKIGAYGASVGKIAILRALRSDLSRYKIAEPMALTEAFAVFDRITDMVEHPARPDVLNGTPDEVAAAITESLTAASRAAVANELRDQLLHPALMRIALQFQALVPTALTAVGPRFEDAAERFTDAYAVVRGATSITEAALRDTDGTTVAAWHKARTAAQELDDLVLVPLRVSVRHDGSVPGRDRENPERFYVAGADLGSAPRIEAFTNAVRSDNPTFKSDDRTNPPTFPLGIWAPILESGASLSLPASLDDWDDRVEDYHAARDSYYANTYR